MVKPNKNFTNDLEKVLASVWQINGEHLDGKHVSETREAVIDVRTIYRNKGGKLIGEGVRRYSQSIDFSRRRYRAGYIASFGERHAYFTYHHLKKVQTVAIDVIPEPRNSELTVTIIGARAALEIFGLCYFYNETKHRIKKLKLNCIERIDDWQSDRDTVFKRVIEKTFPKLKVTSKNIAVNLIQDNILYLSHDYDNLADSDIILIYNVLNEITANHSRIVWKNLEYLLKICNKQVLILLAEPAAKYTRTRVQPILDHLSVSTKKILLNSEGEEFVFDTEPLKIEYENDKKGLNLRLFGNPSVEHKPTLEKSMKRIHLACIRDPLSPISKYVAERQFRSNTRDRDERHRFKKSKDQTSFNNINSDFGSEKVIKKYFNEP